MKKRLTKKEIAELKEAHRTIKDRRNCDRIKTILLIDQGYNYKKISEILLVDENTITEWKKRYTERKNSTGWLFNDYDGYSGKLTKKEEDLVEKYVTDEFISDSRQVKKFIEESFKKSYTISGVIALLHRLKFNYKQTTLIPAKHNADTQKEWKETFEEFVVNLKEDETVVFADGMHPTHNAVCGKAWIKIGETKEIKANSGRQRCNLNGAYNPITFEVIVKDYRTLDTQATLEFLKEIKAKYPNKASIYLVIDNAQYYKNKEVRHYAEKLNIELIFLPPYSPNLNLIERFWKLVKKNVMKNQYYENFKAFKEAIFDFCNRSNPEFTLLLKQFVGTKLHLLSP